MIKVLVVCSFNSGKVAPFIKEQVNSLKQFGTSIDYYLIQGKGPVGYLKNYFPLLEKLKQFKPNIIHAHYGYSGLLSLLQRIIPVVCTFHGTDVSLPQNRILSFLVSRLAKENIFVHSSQPRLLKYEKTINGNWEKIFSKKGDIIVNFGDMLQLWSNNQVKATQHRVIGTNKRRFSIPFFFNPRHDTIIKKNINKPHVLAGDYLAYKYDTTYRHKQ